MSQRLQFKPRLLRSNQMDRPKFLRNYADGVRLRVEQIRPDLWVGTVVYGPMAEPQYPWDVFTALTEESAKRSAMATVQSLLPDKGDRPWLDLSDEPDEDWARSLADRGFPGYSV